MKATGRGWAYLGAILGGALSIAANVAHSYIAGDPSVLKVVFSVAWPVLLFVGIEVLARVAFPAGWGYAVLRFVGVGGVALVAALVSYRHMSGLFEHYGEDAVTVNFGPVAVDGLLAVCSAALILTARKRALTAEAAEPATTAPLFVPTAWTETAPATPRQTPQDAPAQPSPAPSTPEPAPIVLDALAAPEPAAEPEPAPAADLRMVTRLAFGPLPEVGDPKRSPAIRERAEMLKAEDPKRTQQSIADLLGIPRRTLRDALAATSPQPTSPPALTLVSTS